MSAIVSLYLDTRRQKNDGTFPAKLRVTFQRKQQYYPTGINLTESQWEKVGKPKPREDYIRDAKRLLENFSNRAEKIIREMPLFTFDEFESRYVGSTESPSGSVFAGFERYIEQLKKESRAGTASSYQCAVNALQHYHQRKALLTYQEIDPAWLKGFEQWMINNGNSITTVGIYLRSLRTIYNQAVEDGIVDRDIYPFTKRRYQIPTGRNTKKALTIADIEKIFRYAAEPGSAEEKARDLWLFSYLCNGMNPKDIARLTYQQIGEKQIRFVRAKTERTKRDVKAITVAVTDDVRRIIDKWGQKPISPQKYVFDALEPGISAERELALVRQFTKTINKYIGRIAQSLGIDKDVTTYTARHSFSTVLKRSGAPIEFISESLGHQDIRTTESYLDSFEDDVKLQYANALTSFRSTPEPEQS
ncbi:tyrosine-type recombinase/integrase [Spirosoma sp. HMF4905]|uniref:Tyrosine-type recombinase/integrase n=1 Tax=Spirosoma arboris TaxID=2682092 RepID=A0A7K1S660_9BACT|nr:site-specific integrase [Spirosoma arboris]MVM29302.1 tyrosine-type recombinase/integrase [Spirosoma arboris]